MKKILLFIVGWMFSGVGVGQDYDTSRYMLRTRNAVTGEIELISSDKLAPTYNDSKELVLKIEENGDIWFKPSRFCDCNKCRRHKGLKYLYNYKKKQK